MKNILFLLCVFSIMLPVHAQNNESTLEQSIAADQQPPPENLNLKPEFVFVDEHATFLGGTIDDFREWVQENLVYPKEDLENKIFGRVTVQFAVSASGEVMKVVILNGITPTIDAEVKRVILSSPDWEPAKADGKNVPQQFQIPVVFSLP